MAIEIEHKYLINNDLFLKQKFASKDLIQQAYLHNQPDKTIRVRVKAGKGYLTIKGKAENASRLEYEYEIPFLNAQELIKNFGENIIEKFRYTFVYKGFLWEIDEFLGLNKGLWIAEIELKNINELYELPDWILENVTHDHRYANSNLAIKPFTSW